jgi:iron complex outermembrane recepter protein
MEKSLDVSYSLMAGVMAALLSSATLAGSPAAAPDRYELTEIVVTAEKRDSTVQKTPISMTAISGQELQDRGVSGVAQAMQEVPGVSFASGGPGQTILAIRGLSEGGGESPTIGFYLDETPITPPATASNGKVLIDPGMYDLSRVEVLRGPQGTLYGAGAMGGTIKLVTNAPDPSRLYGTGESIVSGTEGGGINYTQNAMVNLPFASDKAALRLVASHAHTSGWIDRIVETNFPLETNPDPAAGVYGSTRGNVSQVPPTKVYKNVNDENLDSVRASLLVQPIAALSITAAVFYQRIGQGGPNNYDGVPGTSAHYQPFDIAEPFSDGFTVSSLTANYDLDWMRITSASSYLSRRSSMVQDASEAVQNALDLPAFSIAGGGFGASPSWEDDFTKQFSQEVRFASRGEGSFQWLTGVFYSKYKSAQSLGESSAAATALTGGVTDLLLLLNAPTQITQRAWFGNASYQITDQFKLTAGLRYFSYDASESTAGSGLFYTGSLATTNAYGSASDHGLNPMVNLSYTPSDDVMIYTTAAKGFREGAGNFPIPTGSTGIPAQCLAGLEALGRTSAPLSYGPDTVWSYEIGEKSKLLDGRLTLNGDIYYLKWSKVQQPVPVCGLTFTDNDADAAVKGGELEAVFRVTPQIRLTQNVGYAHARFTTSSVESAIVAGQRLIDVPDWTVSSAIEFRTALNAANDLVVRFYNSYASSSEDVTYGLNYIPARDVMGLRFMVKHNDLSAALFIDNLRNTRVDYGENNSLGFGPLNFNRINTNQPRTIGIDLNYGF